MESAFLGPLRAVGQALVLAPARGGSPFPEPCPISFAPPGPAGAMNDNQKDHQNDNDAPPPERVAVLNTELSGWIGSRRSGDQPRRRRPASPAMPSSARAPGEGTWLITKVTAQSSADGLVSWSQKV